MADAGHLDLLAFGQSLGPTVPTFWTANPTYAEVQNEHVGQTAWDEVIQDQATPQAAAEKVFKKPPMIAEARPSARNLRAVGLRSEARSRMASAPHR